MPWLAVSPLLLHVSASFSSVSHPSAALSPSVDASSPCKNTQPGNWTGWGGPAGQHRQGARGGGVDQSRREERLVNSSLNACRLSTNASLCWCLLPAASQERLKAEVQSRQDNCASNESLRFIPVCVRQYMVSCEHCSTDISSRGSSALKGLLLHTQLLQLQCPSDALHSSYRCIAHTYCCFSR